MSAIEDEFATKHPGAVARRGGEMFIDAEAAGSFIDEAERCGIAILGIEGFLIAEDATYPSLSDR